jgi:hypothetical protein
MTSISQSAFFLLVCLAGCAAQQSDVGNGDLRSKAGQTVHLIGKFGGPGMQADYVIADGQEVYLMGTIDTGGDSLRYGTTVDVRGVLKFHPRVPPRSAMDQTPPDYLFIEDARVQRVPQTGSTP